eukprot:gene39877-49287_t
MIDGGNTMQKKEGTKEAADRIGYAIVGVMFGGLVLIGLLFVLDFYFTAKGRGRLEVTAAQASTTAPTTELDAVQHSLTEHTSQSVSRDLKDEDEALQRAISESIEKVEQSSPFDTMSAEENRDTMQSDDEADGVIVSAPKTVVAVVSPTDDVPVVSEPVVAQSDEFDNNEAMDEEYYARERMTN